VSPHFVTNVIEGCEEILDAEGGVDASRDIGGSERQEEILKYFTTVVKEHCSLVGDGCCEETDLGRECNAILGNTTHNTTMLFGRLLSPPHESYVCIDCVRQVHF
jgi:hypothetical protein